MSPFQSRQLMNESKLLSRGRCDNKIATGLCLFLLLLLGSRGEVNAEVSSADCVAFINAASKSHQHGSQTAISDSIYDHYCRYQKYSSSNRSDTEATFLTDELYGQGSNSGGSSTDQMDHFCHDYQRAHSEASSSYDSDKDVADGAVAAFSTCITAAANGLTMTPDIAEDHISVTFSAGDADVHLYDLDSENLTCRADVDGAHPSDLRSMDLILKAHKEAKIDCSRKTVVLANGKQGYKTSVMTVGVMHGMLPVHLPADELVEPISAMRLNEEVSNLQQDLEKAKSSIQLIQLELAANAALPKVAFTSGSCPSTYKNLGTVIVIRLQNDWLKDKFSNLDADKDLGHYVNGDWVNDHATLCATP